MKYGANTKRLGADENPWGLRRGAIEAGGGVVGMREIPESRCGFSSQSAIVEWLISHGCPEVGPGKAKSGKQKVEIGTLQVEMAESECDFVLHDADGEVLRRRECQEIGRKG
jgi:hypothetical protein